jgi:NIPSNAP
MIIDHRTYTVAHGRMQEYLERYEQVGLPIQLRHLGRLLGYYVSEIGPLNQCVHLWAYESLADREQRRARMAADAEWQAFLQANAGILIQQKNKLLKPTQFSPGS